MRANAFAIIALGIFAMGVAGQTIPASDVSAFLADHSGTAAFNGTPVGQKLQVRAWTTNLPVTFTRMVKNDEGEWRIDPEIGIGGSYVYVAGEGTKQSDGSVKVDADFFIGPTLHVAIAEDPDDEEVGSNILVGGVMGIKSVSVMVAYDLMTERTVIGAGTSIGTFLIGSLKKLQVID